MTDLQMDVDLPHPPERVWRALTDRWLLSEWWLPTDLMAEAGETFRAFPPADTAGMPTPFDIDVLEVREPSMLLQRWSGDELHTQVSWEIVERPDGSRLRFSQQGFFGLDGTRRRRDLCKLYEVMFNSRLPATLDRLASGSVDLSVARVDLRTAIPRQRGLDQVDEELDWTVESSWEVDQALSSQRRVRLLSLIGAAVLVVLMSSAIAVIAVGGGNIPSWPRAAREHAPGTAAQGGDPAGVPGSKSAAARTAGPATGTPDHAVSGSADPVTESPLPADPTALTASYRTVALLGVGGFDTEVTVRNPGADSRLGWTVVLVMPADNAVENRSPGVVTVSQAGDVVTITPIATQRDLAANGTLTFTVRFQALLAPRPAVETCTIDGRPCAAG